MKNSKSNRKAPVKTPMRPHKSKFLKLPVKDLAPEYDELTKDLRALVPNIKKNAFNNFLLIGYRRLPESERQRYGGAEEAPFYFYAFDQLFPAGAVTEWVLEDIKQRILQAQAQKVAEQKKQEKESE